MVNGALSVVIGRDVFKTDVMVGWSSASLGKLHDEVNSSGRLWKGDGVKIDIVSSNSVDPYDLAHVSADQRYHRLIAVHVSGAGRSPF